MAKVVDHGERRLEVINATWRVIARDGIDGASVRAIAHEVGWSTGVLAHYFVNKDEILQGALQLAHTRVMERGHRRAAEANGAVTLLRGMAEGIPLDADRMVEVQVEVAFWGRAVANRRLNDLQHREFDAWEAFLRQLVEATAERQELTAETDLDELVAAIVAVIDGIGLEAVLYPERITPERQLGTLLATLRPALTPEANAAVAAAADDILASLSTSR
jgi:AcrR family transcriptional regulator